MEGLSADTLLVWMQQVDAIQATLSTYPSPAMAALLHSPTVPIQLIKQDTTLTQAAQIHMIPFGRITSSKVLTNSTPNQLHIFILPTVGVQAPAQAQVYQL
jgi:hypothetical protein